MIQVRKARETPIQTLNAAPAAAAEKSLSRFNRIFFALVGSSCLGTFLINTLVDPLWHFNGNTIRDENYSFNERISKTNQYLKNPEQYDCLIFGSSRTTLLNQELIDGKTCFNFSFAAGRIEEFLAYAQWISKKGNTPDHVIVAIEYLNFKDLGLNRSVENSLPPFIREDTYPPHFLQSYLSLESLWFSVKTLLSDSPRPRLYDGSFNGVIKENPPVYQPVISSSRATVKADADGPYQALAEIFSEADFVGYVPPLSPWIVASKSETEINNFLESVYRISRFVQPLYDFSAPQAITRDTDSTYDGSHYSLEVNQLIAESINKQAPTFGVRVDLMTREDYFQYYYDALATFRAGIRAERLGKNVPK